MGGVSQGSGHGVSGSGLRPSLLSGVRRRPVSKVGPV